MNYQPLSIAFLEGVLLLFYGRLQIQVKLRIFKLCYIWINRMVMSAETVLTVDAER